MLLEEFMADKENAHKQQGNPGVTCNTLYKSESSFNCYLTPVQAIALARNLLQKAQLILDEGIEDAAVHLWNTGKGEKLSCGLNKARKNSRRRKTRTVPVEPGS